MSKRQYTSYDIAVIRNMVLDRLSNPSGTDDKAAFIYSMFTLSGIDPELAKVTSDTIKAEIAKSPQMTEEERSQLYVENLKKAYEEIDPASYSQT